MLAGFENEVLKLPWVGIWRKFSQLFGGYLHCLPLVRFFFAHKELDHILRQQPFTVSLVHASKEFVKVTKNNRLSDANIRRIVSAVAERKDEQHFAHLVPNDEVGSKQNNYNLSVSTYVEQEDTREKVDIVKLNAEIAEIVAREQKLREEIDRIIGEIEGQ